MNGPQGIRVLADLPDYRAAVAQLPLSARPGVPAPGTSMRGAVVVVSGVGPWWRRLLEAKERGAAAAVVADPLNVPPEAIDALAEPLCMPVIVERPRFRPDYVEDALAARNGGPAAMISIECAAPAHSLDAVIRDGMGWARMLGGVPGFRSSAQAVAATAQGRMALFHPGGPPETAVPATVLATIQRGRPSGALLKVLALGATRTEVTVDQPAGFTRLETTAAAGTLRSPARYEASARLALRRAVEACVLGHDVPDLAGLLADGSLAREMTGA